MKKHDCVSTFCEASGRAIVKQVQTYTKLFIYLFFAVTQSLGQTQSRNSPSEEPLKTCVLTQFLPRLYSTPQASHCRSACTQHESQQVNKTRLVVHHPVRGRVLEEGVAYPYEWDRRNQINAAAGSGRTAAVWGPYLGEVEAVLEPRGWFGRWARCVDAAVPQAASV